MAAFYYQYRNQILFSVMAGLLLAVAVMQGLSVSLTILNLCLISAIMSLGVNIQWGYAGLFNVGVMGLLRLAGLQGYGSRCHQFQSLAGRWIGHRTRTDNHHRHDRGQPIYVVASQVFKEATLLGHCWHRHLGICALRFSLIQVLLRSRPSTRRLPDTWAALGYRS